MSYLMKASCCITEAFFILIFCQGDYFSEILYKQIKLSSVYKIIALWNVAVESVLKIIQTATH